MKRGQGFVLVTGFSLVVVATLATAACAVGANNTTDDAVDDASAAPVDRATPPKADTGVKPAEDATATTTEDAAADTAPVTPDSGIKDSGIKDSGSVDSGAADSGAVDSGPRTGCAALRINEVQVAGSASASDEFVEIFNTSTTDTVSTNGCKLVYRSTGNTSDIDCFSATISIAPLGYAVLGGTAFGGAATAKLSCSGLAGTGGQLAIFDGATIVESMAYGQISATPGKANFMQNGTSGPVPAVNQSIGRTPDGHDTHDTGADFILFTKPTPGTANQ